MKTAIGFSGGLDSTYVLWRMLSTTTDEITAVFFDLSYLQQEPGRVSWLEEVAPYQKISASNVAQWLRTNVRDFKFKITVVKSFDGIEPTKSLRLYHIDALGPLVANNTYDRIAFGHGARNSNFPSVPKTGMAVEAKLEMMKYAAAETLYEPIPNWSVSTFDMISELPTELYALTYSCTRPSIGVNGEFLDCGKCEKCVFYAIAEKQIAEGVLKSNQWAGWLMTTPSFTYDDRGVNRTATLEFIKGAITRNQLAKPRV